METYEVFLTDDALETLDELSRVAGSFHDVRKPGFEGYKRINFLHHKYAMLYRLEGDIAYVVRVFHQSQELNSPFE